MAMLSMLIHLFLTLTVLASAPKPQCRNHLKVRTFSGHCNNLHRPFWGQTKQPFKLIARPVSYNIAHLPNARHVSNIICKERRSKPNRRSMSEFVTFFGQFLDHTITRTERSEVAWPIVVPPQDKKFKSGSKIPFFRTVKKKRKIGYSPINQLSSFIDLSSIYGSNRKHSNSLRTWKDGRLKMRNGLPFTNARGQFVSGDTRINENPLLTSFHALFIREHNRLTKEVRRTFPKMNEEDTFQFARKINIAQLQAIVYYEFIPAVLGKELPKYIGYKKNVMPAVSNAFSTIAFRVGHTMINDDITSKFPNGRTRTRKLKNVFNNPAPVMKDGLDNIFRGMMDTRAAEVDAHISPAVRDFLFEKRNVHLDLAALNIQRSRDHGVPPYNKLRRAFGLRPVSSFSGITRNKNMQQKLRNVYGRVNRVDAWVGGIAEDHMRGSSMGKLFTRIWMKEFGRLRDGDRFYFERKGHFKAWEIRKIPTLRKLLWQKSTRRQVMRIIIVKNTGIPVRKMPKNPFFCR